MTAPLSTTERLWGCESPDAVFGDHPKVIVPWPPGDRQAAISALPDLRRPVHLELVDPRVLRASQGWVLHQHLQYYLLGAWEETGRTSADRGQRANRFPIVIGDTILTGHHRAVAALISGRPLVVRKLDAAEGMPALTPTLFLGHGRAPLEGAECVPDEGVAREVLARRGLTDIEIDDRITMATTGRTLCS